MSTYKFIIRSPLGINTFGASKVRNWNEIQTNIVRNKTYKGLTRAYTNTFEFVGDIKKLFLDIEAGYGIGADVYMRIFVGNDNKERSSFVPFNQGQEFKAKLSAYEVGELAYKVNFVDTGFQEQILSRDTVKVNYDTADSLDGIPITPYEVKQAVLHDRTLFFNSESELQGVEDEGVYTIFVGSATGAGLSSYFALPVVLIKQDDKNFKNVSSQTSKNPYSADSFFYLQSEKDRAINLEFDFAFDLIMTESIGDRLVTFKYTKVDEQFNVISTTEIDSYLYDNVGDSHNFVYNASITEPIKTGESLQLSLEIRTGVGSLDTTFDLKYTQRNYITCESTEVFESTTSDIILPHELFTRLVEIYTGVPNAFYSKLFGRVDLGYAEDGEWAYLPVANGKMIRGFEFELNPLNTSLKDQFESFNSVLNIAATIEIIGGSPRFRIEENTSIYDTSSILDLGNAVSEVTRKPNKELLFNSINVGYKDYEYEEVNGLDAFNGEFIYSMPLNIKDNAYKIISKNRGDDIGIELTRRKQFALSSTEDYRTDNHIFFIHCELKNGIIQAKRAEDFTSITGILEPQNVYNAEISPKRNLLRHGDIIRSSVIQQNSKELIYVKGANNAEMQSQLLTESTVLIEKGNVVISSLTNPKFLADLITVNCPFTKAQWDDLKVNQNKMLKFTYKNTASFIFIDDLKYNLNEEKVEIIGLRANR